MYFDVIITYVSIINIWTTLFQIVLSDDETSTAISYLQAVWNQIVLVQSRNKTPNAEDEQNISIVDNDTEAEDVMEQLLVATENRKRRARLVQVRRQPNNLLMILKEFNNHPRVNSKDSILQFWEGKKLTDPQLYQLAITMLAIPCTQVSVERLFSSLKYVLSDLRYNLKDSIVEDILVLRNNTCN